MHIVCSLVNTCHPTGIALGRVRIAAPAEASRRIQADTGALTRDALADADVLVLTVSLFLRLLPYIPFRSNTWCNPATLARGHK